MLSGREAELAGRLREASAAGQTSVVLQLLEEGAPFVVDSVNIQIRWWVMHKMQSLNTPRVHFNIFLSAHKSGPRLTSVVFQNTLKTVGSKFCSQTSYDEDIGHLYPSYKNHVEFAHRNTT